MFRIKERKFSSNIIEMGIENDGKITWIPYLIPVVKKSEGDVLCLKVYEFLKT